MPEQIALRFPDGTKSRIKEAALPGETQTATILRALAMLEGASPARQSTAESEGLAEVRAALSALTRRIDAIEAGPVVQVVNDTNRPSSARTRASIKGQGYGKGTEPSSARDRAAQLRAGGRTLRDIADALNQEGHPTRSGVGQWHAAGVRGLLA